MTTTTKLHRYDRYQSYDWNYDHAPDPVDCDPPPVAGDWKFCGLPVNSPLGVPAGPLLNGKWCRYYASLGFDVLTYKTVRSSQRNCYELPNLQPVTCGSLHGAEGDVPASETMQGSWAVSFGMPSKSPEVWRRDIEQTKQQLGAGKLLSVSVVGTVQEGWSIEELADDYALCAKWALESGADCIETNFSCPNVSTCDGQLYSQPEDAAVVAGRIRESIGETPYLIKVGRIVQRQDAEEMMRAIGPICDAIAMTNSIATTIRANDGHLMFDGQKRGICGEATREASLDQVDMIRDVAHQLELNVELVGVGGAATAEHVRQYLERGAHAVHLATAAMSNPGVALEIRKDLSA